MSHAQPERGPGAPTPPWGGPPRPARGRRATGRPTPPTGFAHPGPGATAGIPRAHRRDRLARPRARAVALARVLAGGLVVLAVVVLLAPVLLGGPGPGADTVAGHLVGAVLAVGATAVAAHRRTASGPALAAAAAVPVILLAVLWSSWWA
ncbi:MAG: hypothetical protein K0S40_504 [Actinomycetospora sp.]|nr:hypothetical protein [Actinomycetospora sp.]